MNTYSLQLSDIELKMFSEVFEVMSKYSNKTRTFGLQLVHSHFPLQDGEILHETNDPEKRVLEVRPVNVKEYENKALATSWCCASDGSIEVSMICCDSTPPIK